MKSITYSNQVPRSTVLRRIGKSGLLRKLVGSSVAAFFAMGSLAPFAQANTWDGGAGTGNWADINNWNPNGLPNFGAGINFAGAVQTITNNNQTGVTTGITFDGGGGAFTLGGNTVNNSGNIINNSAANQTINLGVTVGNAQTWQTNAGGSMTFGAVTLNNTLQTTAANGNINLNGVVGGGSGITHTAGTLNLANGGNTFTGALLINGGTVTTVAGSIADTVAVTVNNPGTLQLGGNETIGSLAGAAGGTVNLGANTLTTGDATNTTFAGQVNGAGGLTKQGTGTFTLNGNNGYAGTTNINAGTLVAGNANALGTTAGGTTVAAGGTLLVNAGVILAAEPININGAGSNAAGNIGVLGGGTATVTGVVTVGTTNAVVTAGNGNTLVFTGGIVKNGVNLIVGNTAGGANTATSGTVNINTTGISGTSGVNSFNSDVLFTAGTTNLNVANPFLGATWLNNGAVVNATVTGALPSLVADGGNAATRTALIMDADNLANFPVGNFPTPPAGAIGSTGGSILNMTANQAVQFLASGPTSPGTSIININNNSILTFGTTAGTPGFVNNTLFSGSVRGAGPGFAVIKDGTNTQIVTGNSTFIGQTSVNGGTLQVGNGVTAGTVWGSGQITVQPGATLDVRLAGASNFGNFILTNGNGAVTATNTVGTTTTFTSQIAGTGTFAATGGGTAVFAGQNIYTGGTTISNASTLIVGNVGSAGQAGTGNFSLAGGSTLNFFNLANTTVNGNIDGTAGNNTVRSTSAQTIQLNGAITNTGGNVGVTQDGAGTLILTNVGNSYTGVTAVNTGILIAATNNALGGVAGGTTVAPNAALVLANGIVVGAEPLTINGNGNVGLAAPGALTQALGGSSTFGGAITVQTASTISTNGAGTLTLTGTINKTDVNLTLTGGGIINLNGAITGGNFGNFNDDLIVNGVTANLNAANTYLGPTIITSIVANDGIVNANVANALPTANGRTAVRMDAAGAGGSTLNIGGSLGFPLGANQSAASLTGAATSKVTLGANTLTLGFTAPANGDANANFAGVISGTGNIIKDGASTQIFSGANTYSGTTTISANGGILIAANNNALGATSGGTTVGNGGSLLLANGIAIGAEPLTINGNGVGGIGALTQAAAGSSSFAGAITVQTASTIGTNGAGTLTLTGTINKTNVNLTLTGGGIINLNGAITGDNVGFDDDLIVNGVTANLNAANTYLGPTIITSIVANDGIVNANVANALPTANGRTAVRMDAAGAGGSTLNIGGSLGFPLGANQSAASLTGAATSKVTLGANTLTLGFTAPANGDANANFAGVISSGAGVGGIIKDGASTQIFSGANTYTGSTTVNGGILQAGIANVAFGVNSPVTIGAAGTLELAGFNNTIGSLAGAVGGVVRTTGANATLTTGALGTNTNFAGSLQNGVGGILAITKVGVGIQTLSGNNTYTGATTVNGGTLLAGSTTAFGVNSVTTVNAGSILDLGGFNNSIGALAGGGANSFVQNSGVAAAALTITGAVGDANYAGVIRDVGGALSLIKNGASNQTLSGINTFTGTVQINAGTLTVAGGAAIADTVAVTQVAPSFFVLTNSETIGSLQGAGNVNLNNQTLTTGGNGNTTTYTGNIGGAGGSLVKNGAGVFTLAGGNNYTGTTTINAGTLNYITVPGPGTHVGGGNYAIGAAGTLSGNGAITLAAGASFNNAGIISVGNALVAPVASVFTLTTSAGGAINMLAGSFINVDILNGVGLGNNAVPANGTSDNLNLVGTLNANAGGTLRIGNPNGLVGFRGGDAWLLINNNTGAGGNIVGTLGLNDAALGLTPTQVGNFNQVSGVYTVIDTITGIQMANIMGQSVMSAAQGMLGDVNGRLFFLRAGYGERGYDGSLNASLDSGVESGEGDMVGSDSSEWQAYLNANYNNVSIDAVGAQQAGFDSDTWTAGVGFERSITPNFTLGFAANWLESQQDFSSNVGKLDMSGIALSAYGSYVRKAFWADMLYSFGSFDIETNRNTIGFGNANGNTDAMTHAVQFNTGWNFRFQDNSLVTGPMIGVDYMHATVDGFSETSGGLAALRYNSRNYDSLISRVGWSLSKKVDTDFAKITAQVRLSYERQNIKHDNQTSVSLINQPFTPNSAEQNLGQDYMAAGAGLNFQFTPRFGVLLNYQGQFFRQSVQAHFVNIRAGFSF